MSASTAVLATRSSRFVARVVDAFVIALPMLLMSLLFPQNGYNAAMMMNGNPSQMMLRGDPTVMMMTQYSFSAFGLVILAYIVLQAYLLTTRGQSLGKILLKIRIANVKTGQSKGFVQNVLLREILNGIIGVVPFYKLVDALFIFRQDKRCIHDHIASTVVVKA